MIAKSSVSIQVSFIKAVNHPELIRVSHSPFLIVSGYDRRRLLSQRHFAASENFLYYLSNPSND